jgi:hypothetical protein
MNYNFVLTHPNKVEEMRDDISVNGGFLKLLYNNGIWVHITLHQKLHTFHAKLGQTGNTSMNVPSNDTILDSITNKSSLNTTMPNELPPQSINGSKVPKI